MRLAQRAVRITLWCVLAAASVTAQNRANFPWWNSTIVDDQALNLSPSQKLKIRQIVRSHRARLLDSRNTVNKAEGDLEDFLNEPEVNSELAKPIIENLAEARAASSRVFLDMSVQLRAVLTLDQWRVLVRRWDELQRKKTSDTQVPP